MSRFVGRSFVIAARVVLLPPWRRAPTRLRSTTGLAAAAVCATACLALASSVRPIYEAASGGAALRDDLTNGCAADVGLRIQQVVSTGSQALPDADFPSVEFGAANAAIESAVAPIAGLQPSTAVVFGGEGQVSVGSRIATVQALAKTGAQGHVSVLRSGGDGAWLSQSTVLALGVDLGDSIDVALGDSFVRMQVGGVFEDLAARRDASWCSIEDEIVGTAMTSRAPIMLVDRDLLLNTLAAGHVMQAACWWEVQPKSDAWTLPTARRARDSLRRIAQDALNGATPLGRVLRDPHASVDLPGSVEHAEQAAVVGNVTIAPVTLGLGLLSLVILAGVARTWLDRRRQELLVLRMHGASALLLGLKGMLEFAPLAAVGAALGTLAAIIEVGRLGPAAAMASEAVATAWIGLCAVWGIAMLAIGTLVVGECRRDFVRGVQRRRVSSLPVAAVVLLGLAAGSFYELRSRGTGVVRAGQVFRADFFVLLFPILFIAGGSTCIAYVLSRLWDRVRVRTSAPFCVWSASRRLAAHHREGSIVVVCAAVALGSSSLGASLSESMRATIVAKSTLGLGAQQVVPLNTLASASPSVPAELGSLVTRLSEASIVVAGHDPADVLAIDPASFTRVAYWDASFSAVPLASLVREIAPSSEDGAVPVLAVGGGLPDRFDLTLPRASGTIKLPVRVVARPRAFPGLGYGSSRSLVVLNATALTGLAIVGESQVWAKGDSAALLGQLQAEGFDATVVRRASLLVPGGSLPQQRALRFLAALGTDGGVVALCALGLYYAALGRRRLVGDTVAFNSGVSRRAAVAATSVEAGAMLVSGLILGVALSWAAIAITYRHFDPLPEVAPHALWRLDKGVAIVALALSLAMTFATGAIQDVRRHRASRDEVIRRAG